MADRNSSLADHLATAREEQLFADRALAALHVVARAPIDQTTQKWFRVAVEWLAEQLDGSLGEISNALELAERLVERRAAGNTCFTVIASTTANDLSQPTNPA